MKRFENTKAQAAARRAASRRVPFANPAHPNPPLEPLSVPPRSVFQKMRKMRKNPLPSRANHHPSEGSPLLPIILPCRVTSHLPAFSESTLSATPPSPIFPSLSKPHPCAETAITATTPEMRKNPFSPGKTPAPRPPETNFRTCKPGSFGRKWRPSESAPPANRTLFIQKHSPSSGLLVS